MLPERLERFWVPCKIREAVLPEMLKRESVLPESLKRVCNAM